MAVQRLGVKDVLVVGSGLAGICIAERLEERGVSFKVIDDPDNFSSTEVSTGMYNPIAFRRINKSWMVDDLLPELQRFYSNIEDKLEKKYNQPITFAKRIPSNDYAALWSSRQAEDDYQSYIKPIEDGLGHVLNAGMIDCASLTNDYRTLLRVQNRLIESPFDLDIISGEERQYTVAGQNFDHIIFCEGPYAAENQLWNWLPFNICKGEWVNIQTEREVSDIVLNNVLNIIPLGDCKYKLSSTYRWNDRTWDSTDSSTEELCRAFEQIYDVKYEIIERKAGLRPTVADRRPYLGRHPRIPSISIFNGLGSKGVMLAPYFSKQLVDHLLDDSALFDEVNIRRHIKRFELHTNADKSQLDA